MTPLARFRALFSPQRQWIDAAGDRLGAGGRWGPKEGILRRSVSIYRRYDFSTLPPARRRNALDLAVRQFAPREDLRFACRWQEGLAHVWIPREPIDLDDDWQLVSESSLVPAPQEDGVRLFALREGVEGQSWSVGQLVASRWWPDVPSQADWHRFLRATGLSVSGEVPEVQQLTLAAMPWGSDHGRFRWSTAQIEAAVWRSVVVVVGAVLGWQLAAATVWSLAIMVQEYRLDAVRADSAPLIAAREQAESAKQRLLALHGQVDAPSDLALIAEVRRAIPSPARVQSWTREADRLRVELQGAGDDPRPIVQAFSGHPLLGSVVANPLGPGRMQLDVELDARQEEVLP